MSQFKFVDAPYSVRASVAAILGTVFLVGYASPSSAAEESADSNNDEQLTEITVTGSRIRNVDGMSTPTPVTAVTAEALESYNAGATVAEQLDNLPQFFQTQTAQRGGGTFIGAAGSYLNLRGMGANRTLVLLDGARTVPADSFGSVNVDNIPSALIKRIDVVTGGASAAYGADAVAGVVNFIIDREFTGVKANVSGGITQRNDGENFSASITGGGEPVAGLHLVGSAMMRNIKEVRPDPTRFDSWQNWGYVNNPAWVNASSGVPRRITVPNVYSRTMSPTGLILGARNAAGAAINNFALNNFTFTDDGRSVRPYVLGQYGTLPGGTQSAGPEYGNYLRSVDLGSSTAAVKQLNFFGAAKYEVSEKLSLRAQAMLGRTESNNDGLRGNNTIDGGFGGSYNYTIYRENPYLPQSVVDAMTLAGADSIEIGKRGQYHLPGLVNIYDNRVDRNRSEQKSFTLGLDYSFNDNWNVTANIQRGKSNVDSGVQNIPRIDRLYTAIDAVRDGSGNTVCNITRTNPTDAQLAAFMAGKLLPSPLSLTGVPASSPIGPLNPAECIPVNILGAGTANQAAVDWIEGDGKTSVRTLQQDFAEMVVSGELYEGWGAGPVSMAAGATYRKEIFTQAATPSYGDRGVLNAPALGIRGISRGFTGPGNRSLHPFSAIGAGTNDAKVNELFTEFNVPVFELSTGQELGSVLAYRISDYSGSGRVDSWKVGLDFEVLQDLRLRLTKSRDVREPNFSEKYVAGSGGGSVIDPMQNRLTNASLTVVSGPNPTLTPEKADTLAAGLVYQPTFAPWIEGVKISLDMYDIKLKSAVARYGAQRLTDDCFLTGDAHICSLVQRAPLTATEIANGYTGGSIQRVIDEYVNVGAARTRGMDLEIQHTSTVDFLANQPETLNVRLLGGYLKENSTTSAVGTKTDLVNSIERPDFSATVSANYKVGPFGVNLVQTYEASTKVNNQWREGVDIDNNTIPALFYTNLGLSYSADTTSGRGYKVGFSITNLFDSAPPVVPGSTGQVLSNRFDDLGRRFQLSLDVNLK